MLGRQYMVTNSEKKNQGGSIPALFRDTNKYQLAKEMNMIALSDKQKMMEGSAAFSNKPDETIRL